MSIIGDGIMLGAGGETASIVVTAPAGSTVTCTTPAGIVLTAAEVDATWTFARLKSYGTYAVTATDGENTKTKKVLVDIADVIAIKMTYSPDGALYWLGDDCADITGGWHTLKGGAEASGSNYPYIYADMENQDASLYCVMPSKGQSVLTTVIPVSTEGFGTLNIQFSAKASGETGGYVQLYAVFADTVEDNMRWDKPGTNFQLARSGRDTEQGFDIANKIVTIDISSVAGKFIGIWMYRYNGSLNFTLHKLWLE